MVVPVRFAVKLFAAWKETSVPADTFALPVWLPVPRFEPEV